MAQKDFDFFGFLYDDNYEKILNYIIYKTGDIRASADITSEVFFKAMKNLPRFKWQKVPFSNWLYKIAQNEIVNFYNKEKKQGNSLDWLMDEVGYEPQDKTDIENEIIEAQEQLEKLQSIKKIKKNIKQLDKKYQDVIFLRFWKKMKTKDISFFLNKNENTIKSLLMRGVEMLRENNSMQLKTKKSVISLEQKNETK
jgi:RNA polymerase sigma-70 factor (ECF subfamily)